MVWFIDAPAIARHKQGNLVGLRERRVLDHGLVAQNNLTFSPSLLKALGHRGTIDLKVVRSKDPGPVLLLAADLGTNLVKVLLEAFPLARGPGTLRLKAGVCHCCTNRKASSRDVLGLKAGSR